MNVELSKKDIIRLVRGTDIPDYATMFKVKNMGLGVYIGGFVDSFEWHDVEHDCWDKYSEKELFELYLKLSEE